MQTWPVHMLQHRSMNCLSAKQYFTIVPSPHDEHETRCILGRQTCGTVRMCDASIHAGTKRKRPHREQAAWRFAADAASRGAGRGSTGMHQDHPHGGRLSVTVASRPQLADAAKQKGGVQPPFALRNGETPPETGRVRAARHNGQPLQSRPSTISPSRMTRVRWARRA